LETVLLLLKHKFQQRCFEVIFDVSNLIIWKLIRVSKLINMISS